MYQTSYREAKHCRWCGSAYYARMPKHKSGFCTKAHKQAHYRAYKNYVTAVRRRKRFLELKAVTPKKAKKKGKTHVKKTKEKSR